MGGGGHTFWYFSVASVPLAVEALGGGSSAASSMKDSFSTSARGLEPAFFVAAPLVAFFGGVCDMTESSSKLSPESSSLSILMAFFAAPALPFPVRVVWVFLGAAFLGAAFLGAALALGF